MYIALTILIVIAAVLLVLLVLVQNSKGGGLAAGFNSGNQVMGVRKTTDFLEKSTWTIVALIVLLSVFSAGMHKREMTLSTKQSHLNEAAAKAMKNQKQNNLGSFPIEVPTQNEQAE